MYSVNFIFRNSSVTQGFVFKTQGDAKSLVDQVRKKMVMPLGSAQDNVVVDDDYGCHGTFMVSDVNGIVLNDVAREYEKAQEFRRLEQESMKSKFATTGFIAPAQGIIGNQWDGKKS